MGARSQVADEQGSKLTRFQQSLAQATGPRNTRFFNHRTNRPRHQEHDLNDVLFQLTASLDMFGGCPRGPG
jgi:hypothetical protein